MDLSTLDTRKQADEGAVMIVKNPATDETLLDAKKRPVSITLLGLDSERVKVRQRQLTNESLKKGFRAKPSTAEKIEEDNALTLAIATVSWSGIEVDGKALECTRENAAELYVRFPWLREQVDTFVGDRANFLKA